MNDGAPLPLDPAHLTLLRHGTGKPLVMIHCLGQSAAFWNVLKPLATQYELISYSLPGHPGAPPAKGPYGVPDLSAQLRAAALAAGLTKFHLMGISLGGSVALHFAGTYPDMVDQLVLADCTPRYDDESRANWPVRGALARTQGVASLIPMLMPIFFTPASLAENGPDVRHVRETFQQCNGEAYAMACAALGALDARDQAARITAPTLILCGSDERQSFKDAASWMQRTIAGSTLLEVPEAGHASIRERPAFVISALRRFLS